MRLRSAAQGGVSEARLRALQALIIVAPDEPDLLELLKPAFEDDDPLVRFAAIYVLEHMDRELAELFSPVISSLSDADPSDAVRIRARSLLAQFDH